MPTNGVHLRRSKNNIPKARMRTLKMSVVIVLSFIVCWTPYYLLGLWYWFFPSDLESKVSHSLTHILFIFGLLNACLDPLIYGFFTIHFRKGLKRYYINAAYTADVENSTVISGSFTSPANSLSLRRELRRLSEEKPVLCSNSPKKVEPPSLNSSFLIEDRHLQQSCPEAILWGSLWMVY